MDEQPVAVYWDALPAINASGFEVAQAIQRSAESLGQLKSFKYYVDVNGGGRGASFKVRSELKCAGVTIVDTASEGRESSPAKMMLTDAFVYALDNRAPQKLLFVSEDLDVCYAISLLRLRGYEAYILCPTKSGPAFSHFHLPGDFDGSLLETKDQESGFTPPDSPPTHIPPHVEPSYSQRRYSAPSGGPSDNPSTVLPSIEIDEFRQKFANRRPILDSSLLGSFRPSQRSASPVNVMFGHTNGDEEAVFDEDEEGIAFGKRPRDKGKGKERAKESPRITRVQPSESTLNSRVNSFDSYIIPPSVSTAPTSAMPFHSDGSKVGEPKYQSLFGSAIYYPPYHLSAETYPVPRSTSQSTNDSGAGTVTAISPTIHPSHSPSSNSPRSVATSRAPTPFTGVQHPSPRYEVLPSLLPAPLPPLFPETIQVRHVTGGSTPSIGTPIPSGSIPLTPRTLTPIRPPAPAPVPGPTPVRTATPIRSMSVPVASTSTQVAPTPPPGPPPPAPSNAQPNAPTGVPIYFQHLIDVLREYRTQGDFQVDRGNICKDLFKRDPKILVAAGTAEFQKPFVLYFEDAHAAGIIVSPTGKVELADRYK